MDSQLQTLNVSDEIKREFTIDDTGKGKTTLRGMSRLLGISQVVMGSMPVVLIQSLAIAGIGLSIHNSN